MEIKMSTLQDKHPKNINNISEGNKSNLRNSQSRTLLEKLGLTKGELDDKGTLDSSFRNAGTTT